MGHFSVCDIHLTILPQIKKKKTTEMTSINALCNGWQDRPKNHC